MWHLLGRKNHPSFIWTNFYWWRRYINAFYLLDEVRKQKRPHVLPSPWQLLQGRIIGVIYHQKLLPCFTIQNRKITGVWLHRLSGTLQEAKSVRLNCPWTSCRLWLPCAWDSKKKIPFGPGIGATLESARNSLTAISNVWETLWCRATRCMIAMWWAFTENRKWMREMIKPLFFSTAFRNAMSTDSWHIIYWLDDFSWSVI